MYNISTNIKKWAIEDRPREKFISIGKSNISNAELLAILIGSGSKNASAIDVARNLLLTAGNSLEKLSRMSIAELKKVPGIGPAKAVIIMSALEIGARRREEESLPQKQIVSAKDVHVYFYPVFSGLNHEEFHVLLLNRGNRIIKSVRISTGGIDTALVDVRILMKHALENHACSIVLCHNHPSGNLKPSRADLTLTKEVAWACQTLKIDLLDHIIISGNQFYSLADNEDFTCTVNNKLFLSEQKQKTDLESGMV